MHRVLNPLTRDPVAAGLCALAVMTKAPRPGQVKTRLVPPLTPDEAAQLNRCFLSDTAAAIAAAAPNRASGIGVYTPVGSEADYAGILPATFALLPQRGGDFGERLTNAAQDLFRIGFGSVCLIDSDSPTVSTAAYAQAARLLALDGDRVVLGPSDDGGYYLIGLKQLHRPVFENIDWSTERVVEQTIAHLRDLNVPIEVLPTGYDVDDAATLRRLRDELIGPNATATNAPRTRQFISRFLAHRQL